MARKQEKPKLLPRLIEVFQHGFRGLCRFIVLVAIMAGSMLILIDVGRFFFQSADFTVKEISVEGNDRITQDELQSLAEIVPGTNIWLVDTDAMQQRVTNHPTVERAFVQRIPPHRLHIRIIERHAIATIWNPEDNRFYGVDENGVIYAAVPNINQTFSRKREEDWQEFLSYPVLGFHEEIDIYLGKTLTHPRTLETLQFLQKLKQHAPAFFSALAECEIQQNESIIFHPKRRIGAMIFRNLQSPDLVKKIAKFWDVLESHDLRVIYADARFPKHGFAVRWDESDGGRWKQLYQNKASMISSL